VDGLGALGFGDNGLFAGRFILKLLSRSVYFTLRCATVVFPDETELILIGRTLGIARTSVF
jgi:hypothetical protein